MSARVFGAFIPDALKWKLRKWVWMRLNPSWTLKSGLVIRVLNYNDWMIYNDIFVDGEYDVPLKRLLEKSTPATARVLDLGANVGFFTLRLADAFLQRGRSAFEVLMIEGSPSTYAELRQRLSVNDNLLSGKIRALHGLARRRSGRSSHRRESISWRKYNLKRERRSQKARAVHRSRSTRGRLGPR